MIVPVRVSVCVNVCEGVRVCKCVFGYECTKLYMCVFPLCCVCVCLCVCVCVWRWSAKQQTLDGLFIFLPPSSRNWVLLFRNQYDGFGSNFESTRGRCGLERKTVSWFLLSISSLPPPSILTPTPILPFYAALSSPLGEIYIMCGLYRHRGLFFPKRETLLFNWLSFSSTHSMVLWCARGGETRQFVNFGHIVSTGGLLSI